jgi:hypothetical protein
MSLGIFSEATDGTMCPGVDSASKNEYQDTPGGKGGRCVRVTTLPPSYCRKSRKSGALTYQIPKGLFRTVAGKLYLYPTNWRQCGPRRFNYGKNLLLLSGFELRIFHFVGIITKLAKPPLHPEHKNRFTVDSVNGKGSRFHWLSNCKLLFYELAYLANTFTLINLILYAILDGFRGEFIRVQTV